MALCTKCGLYSGTYIDFDCGQVHVGSVVTHLPRWGPREAVLASEALLTSAVSHHETTEGGKHPRLHPIEAAVRVPQWIVGAESLAELNEQFQQVVWRIREAIKPYGYSCVKVAPRAMSVMVRPIAGVPASPVILSPQLAWEILGTAQEAFSAGDYQAAYEAARHSLEHYGQCVQAHLLTALIAMTRKASLSKTDLVRSAGFLRGYRKAMRLMIEAMPFYGRRGRKITHRNDIDRYTEILRAQDDQMQAAMSWVDTVL